MLQVPIGYLSIHNTNCLLHVPIGYLSIHNTNFLLQVPIGYLSIHNLAKGKSGLFIVNYLNHLLVSRLAYHGPPVQFNARIDDNNLKLIFPSFDVLRAVVEKLSPVTVG